MKKNIIFEKCIFFTKNCSNLLSEYDPLILILIYFQARNGKTFLLKDCIQKLILFEGHTAA